MLSHDPIQRRIAIVEAGAARDQTAIRDLITRLDSQDPGERLLAITSLVRITNETCGYDYAATPAERRTAILRWTDWELLHGGRPTKGGVPFGQEGVR